MVRLVRAIQPDRFRGQTMTITKDQAEAAIGAGEVLVNIGQIGSDVQRLLDRAVKQGTVRKWRGYWFPIAGAHFGIGPVKSCYALPFVADNFSEFKASDSKRIIP